jgi:hypothetical protein
MPTHAGRDMRCPRSSPMPATWRNGSMSLMTPF